MSNHFIAALGTSCYNQCNYQLNNQTVKTSFIQEALLHLLHFGQGDKVTILLTDSAREMNWEDSIYKARDISALQRFACEGEVLPSEGDKKEGLRSIIQSRLPDVTLNDVTIPDGKTEDEIWRTFEIIYDQISEEDVVYFDITNCFRSLPIIATTILNYSKVLKNITIKGIYYGALEAKDKDTGIVPVFDLTACNDIMDWTVAADSFIHFGNSDRIGELCKSSSDKAFTNAWKCKLRKVVNLTNCIETTRGMEKDDVSNGKNSIKMAYMEFKNAPLQAQNSDNVEKIVLPLYKKIEERAAVFDKKSNFEIGMATVEWSIQNGMIQQGFTALLETIKTFLCNQYGIREHDFETRELVTAYVLNMVKRCKNAIRSDIDTTVLRVQALEKEDIYQEFLEYLDDDKTPECVRSCKEQAIKLANEVPKSLVVLYGEIGDYRNDMNHFGFKKQPNKPNTLHKNLKKCYQQFHSIIDNYNELKLK
ncbi:MAG TPA: TIGR02221 family CRISPR-associated protein [Lachnospiraceae bacterium]|nr:TIGR02221 family CRISPR-associated protein [uncultured Lachnoclostridium sp.]HAU83975.1 TIGR02221 family CRISPR-associated protein [Lachnospiraceae bacterium]